jgi:hypothetical protein
LFDSAKPILELCETARTGFKETVEEINEICQIEYLKEPTFMDSLKVFFWSVSANYDGDFNKSGLKILHDAPYISVNCDGCWWDTWTVNQRLIEFLKAATEMPEKTYEAVKGIVELAQQITSSLFPSLVKLSNVSP